jgi:hypothetical protein
LTDLLRIVPQNISTSFDNKKPIFSSSNIVNYTNSIVASLSPISITPQVAFFQINNFIKDGEKINIPS